VNDEGVVKLADFGASKKVSELQGAMLMTMTMRGTPYFMAPEVFEEKYGYGSDIWSVGCVAIQMLTGVPPWKELGISNPVVLYNHIKKTTGPPLDWKKVESYNNKDAFYGFLKKCFFKDPQQRPGALELQQEAFFIDIHSHSDDEHSVTPGSLFSPGNNSTFGWDSVNSPGTQACVGTPGKPNSSLRRSNSIGGLRSPFMSPPIPRHCEIRAHSIAFSSPQHDTADWPSWARGKLKSSVKSGAMGSPSIASASDLMGSLAISEDSSAPVRLQGRHLFTKTIGEEQTRSSGYFSELSEGSTLKGEALLGSN
jgi:serine/threonine protein kinase